MINVAILGFGVVGSGVAEVLTQNKSLIENKLGQEIRIKYILDLRDFPGNPFESLIVHDFNLILNDPEVTVVAEMLGGSHPAYDFTKACLEAGKCVVTSNKEVVANFGAELLEVAKAHGAAYFFEASVGGGIPLIRPICNDLASNNFTSVSGILNGTTNYILTKMAGENVSFADALSEAQEKGYAERNPAADIEGLDAARKIVILAALVFGKSVAPDLIHTEGITKITSDDVSFANSIGYTIKLICHTEKIGDKILAMVSPRLVSFTHPLAAINGVNNGILVNGDMVGEVMFYGPGAGKLPTASAICADIVDSATNKERGYGLPEFSVADASDIADFSAYSCKRFFIIEGDDSSDCIKKYFVSAIVKKVLENHVCFITDEMTEAETNTICEKIKNCKSYRVL